MVIRAPSKLNSDLELARLFGFACVVLAHGNSLGLFSSHQTLGFVIDELCRSAVPLFFMISGYLWKPAQMDKPFAYVAKMFPRLAVPFLLWVAIYLFFDRVHWFYPTPETRTFRSYVTTPWSGGIAFHLWFLPGLLVGVGLSLTLIKRFGLKAAWWISVGLFLVGCLLGTYLRPFGIQIPLSVYRNGILFAPIFLIAGYYLQTMTSLPAMPIFLVTAIAGAALNLIEGYAVAGTFPHGHDMSLGVIPFGIGVFGLFLHLRSESMTVARWGQDVFGAYLAHVFILKTVIAAIAPSGLADAAPVLAITFLASLLFSRIAKMNRWTRYLAP